MPSQSPISGKHFHSRADQETDRTQRIVGQGEMANLIRRFDWSATAVGPIESWPDTLVTTVNLLLASRHPMFLWWGQELIQFYNDGYRPSIRADKHPSAVGQRGAECWPEIWPIIGPQIDAVMSEGRSTWHTNQLVPINRDGKLEEVYWTYGYSPVRDNAGIVRGTLVVCSETTEQVLAERRLKTMLAITAGERSASQLSQTQTLTPFAREIISTLKCNVADIPFAALYQLNGNDVACLGATFPINNPIGDPVEASSPLTGFLHSHDSGVVDDLDKLTGGLLCTFRPATVTRGYVLPLPLPEHGSSAGTVLIFGISPLLPFDERYETFLKLVGSKIAGLLHTELQRLELLQAAVRFRALAEANPFGMVIGSLRGELKYINPVFLETLGYSAEEVTSGKVRWDNLTPPEYAQADAQAVEQLRRSGRCDVYEKIYIAKDGRRIPILIGASIIDTPEANAEVAAFVTELTPLKTAEEALRKANDELEKKVMQRTAALEAEVVERKRIETSLQELTGRLLRAQDQERRHMARELHDNAGQTLAALSMNLSAIESTSSGENARLKSLASEAKQLSDDLSREIRTLSYLLHPPLLDEIGLESAIRWYVDGFSQRSQITVDLDLPGDAERLPRELELVLFRVVQESLTNVHRHSGSSSAMIHLTRSEQRVEVEISDRGSGISPELRRDFTGAKAGVGVRGMEERIRQFGGTLQIISSHEGTKVLASLPIELDPPSA
jgi:PAS domain S-box-containing protein